MRKLLKIFFSRIMIISVLIALQVVWAVVILFRLVGYSSYIAAFLKLISILAVIFIMRRSDNPAMKLLWVILILLMPLLGGVLYLYVGRKRPVYSMRKKIEPAIREDKKYLHKDNKLMQYIEEDNPLVASQIYYLEENSGFPAYAHSKATYYPSGEECFPAMVEELEKAKEYIFLEYFIIEEGIFWDKILEILKRKVKEGVDVRVMYDDVGCGFVLPNHYDRKLKSYGIDCTVFNRYIPVVSTIFNNRDHRKILVIDGKCAFTGGINFADEYINEKQRFGYWKDNGIRIQGAAVTSMTLMFLTMWNAFASNKLEYQHYMNVALPNFQKPHQEDEDIQDGMDYREGMILPYSDHPLDNELVGENVYLSMINHATKYIYFFTPYLIIDNEIATAMILAAKRGVDVRIITPGIPDKKLVYLVTQSYYQQLVEGGVRIFQFRPGFVHGKAAVCDNILATVGTINLDYRSLYLHFENGIYMYKTPAVGDVRDDFLEALKQSTEITKEMCHRNMFLEILQGILRIIAPLL